MERIDDIEQKLEALLKPRGRFVAFRDLRKLLHQINYAMEIESFGAGMNMADQEQRLRGINQRRRLTATVLRLQLNKVLPAPRAPRSPGRPTARRKAQDPAIHWQLSSARWTRPLRCARPP